jgi:uncharacterized membrane protein
LKPQTLDARETYLYLATLIILLGALLVLVDLDAKSLYVDEIHHVEIEAGRFDQFVRDMVSGPVTHPILAPLLRHLWIRVAGTSDFAVRFIPAALGILCLPLLCRLVAEVTSHELALLSMYCLAIAPVFVMYSRIDKYYSQSVFVTLVSLLAFVKLVNAGESRRWAMYVGSYVVLIHTHYLAAPFTILGQNLLAAARWRRNRSLVRRWILAQVLLPLTYVPWIQTGLSHASEVYGWASADLTQGLKGWIIKIAYLGYSFTLGETIFPWELAAIVGFPLLIGITALGLGHFYSQFRAVRDWSQPLVLVAIFGFLPSIGGIILSLFVFPSVRFVDLPNHLLFALPFFRLAIAGGLLHLTKRWRYIILAVITITSGLSLYNYYTDRHFHNPIFVTPGREIAEDVNARAQQGDVIFAAQDSGVAYYYEQMKNSVPVFTSTRKAREYVLRESPGRVWVITLGRDATRGATPEEFLRWMEDSYRLAHEQGYVEQDILYRRLKEALLHRPAYRYKATVRLYEKAR